MLTIFGRRSAIPGYPSLPVRSLFDERQEKESGVEITSMMAPYRLLTPLSAPSSM